MLGGILRKGAQTWLKQHCSQSGLSSEIVFVGSLSWQEFQKNC